MAKKSRTFTLQSQCLIMTRINSTKWFARRIAPPSSESFAENKKNKIAIGMHLDAGRSNSARIEGHRDGRITN